MDQSCHGFPVFIPSKNLINSENQCYDLIDGKFDIHELGSINPDWFDDHDDGHDSVSTEESTHCLKNDKLLLKSPELKRPNDPSFNIVPGYSISPVTKNSSHSLQMPKNHSSRPQNNIFSNVSPISRAPFSPTFIPDRPDQKHYTIACSTPRSLSACLGADLSSDDHVWSSSMETPVQKHGINDKNTDESNQSIQACSAYENTDLAAYCLDSTNVECSTSIAFFEDSNTLVNSSSKDGSVMFKEDVSKACITSVDQDVSINTTTDVLDFLLATPPSRKVEKKLARSSKKVKFDNRVQGIDENSLQNLCTPVRKKQFIRRVKIFEIDKSKNGSSLFDDREKDVEINESDRKPFNGKGNTIKIIRKSSESTVKVFEDDKLNGEEHANNSKRTSPQSRVNIFENDKSKNDLPLLDGGEKNIKINESDRKLLNGIADTTKNKRTYPQSKVNISEIYESKNDLPLFDEVEKDIKMNKSDGKPFNGDGDVMNNKRKSSQGNSKLKCLRRKMIYPSALEIKNSLPSKVYNLRNSSDGIIISNDNVLQNIPKNDSITPDKNYNSMNCRFEDTAEEITENLNKSVENCEKLNSSDNKNREISSPNKIFYDSQMSVPISWTQLEVADSICAYLQLAENDPLSQFKNESSETSPSISKPKPIENRNDNKDKFQCENEAHLISETNKVENEDITSPAGVQSQPKSHIDNTLSKNLKLGFSTANGKISISNEAMEKETSLFSEETTLTNPMLPCDDFLKSNEKIEPNSINFKKEEIVDKSSENLEVKSARHNENYFVVMSECSSFSTASGKVIGIDKNNLLKAESLFDEIKESTTFYNKEPFEHSMSVTCDRIKTLQKKNKVRNAVNNESQMVLSDVSPSCSDKDPPCKTLHFNTKTDECESAIRTAKSEEISESEQTLYNAIEMFCAENDISTSVAANDVSSIELKAGNDGSNLSSLFLASKNKQISVLEDPFNDVNKTFNNIEMDFQPVVSEEGCDFIKIAPIIPNYTDCNSGFVTASGKKFNISKEALNKANLLFDGTEGDAISSFSKKRTMWSAPSVDKNSSDDVSGETRLSVPIISDCNSAFSTASGKNVTVSGEALERSNLIFSCTEDRVANTFSKETRLNCNSGGLELKSKPIFENTDKEACISNDEHFSTFKKPCESGVRNYNFNAGFSTASGEKFNISKESLKKVTSLFDGIDDGACSSFPNDSDDLSAKATDFNKGVSLVSLVFNEPNNINCNSGFSTASGKKVNISKRALKVANSLFDDIEDGTTSLPFNKSKIASMPVAVGNDSKEHVSEKPPPGVAKISDNRPIFSTASGKKVTISEEALQKSSLLFSDIEDQVTKPPPKKSSNSKSLETKKSLGSLFSTASGKKVTISEEALKKSGLLFSDTEDQVAKLLPKESSYSEDLEMKKSLGSLFSTASSKKVTISEDTLKKSSLLFSDTESRVTEPLPKESDNSESLILKKSLGSLFSTASGKKVTISEDALKKSSLLFSDIEDQVTEPPPEESDNSESLKLKKSLSSPFSTASGKKVTISKEALEQANKIFSSADLDDLLISNNSTSSKLQNISYESIFSTSSGKSAFVSKDSLNKAKSLFAEIELPHFPDGQMSSNGKNSTNSNFSAKNIIMSETAILLGNDCAENHIVPVLAENILDHKEPVKINAKFLPATVPEGSNDDPTTLNCDNRKTLDLAKINNAGNSPYFKGISSELLTGAADGGDGCVKETNSNFTLNSFDPVKDHKISVKSCDDDSSIQYLNQSGPKQNADVNNHKQKRFLKPVLCSPSVNLNDRGQRTFNSYITSPNDLSIIKKKLLYTNKTITGRIKDYNYATDNAEIQNEALGNEDKSFEKKELLSSRKRCLDNVNLPPSKKPHVDIKNITDRNISKNVNRVLARKKQEEIIKKSKVSVKPKPGILMSKSGQNKVKLFDAVQGKTPVGVLSEELGNYGVDSRLVEINSERSEEFKFNFKDHFDGKITLMEDELYIIGDGAMMVLADDNSAGKEEFYKAFLTLKEVDSKLFSEQWFYNHYRWIIWKLVSTEIKFPKIFGGKYLNPDIVMLQLKYRYDREIDRCHRSALKKIMERDEVSIRRMVLCISRIFENPTEAPKDGQELSENNLTMPQFYLELTDGWYPISTVIDDFLSNLVKMKKIKVGQKLVIYGAELIGHEDACSPLDAPSSLKLKITANKTRRARWDAKLGFHANLRPFPIPLSSVVRNGGNIPCLLVTVVRVYPLLFMEKFPDNSTIFRVRKAEEEVKMKHESIKQDYLEKMMNKIQDQLLESELNSNKKRRLSILTKADIQQLQSKEDLFSAFENSSDPTTFMRLLNEDQIKLLDDYRQTRREKSLAEVHSKMENALQGEDSELDFVMKRKVSTLLRTRIVGCHSVDQVKRTNSMLTVWHPSTDLEAMLQEGATIRIYNVNPASVCPRRGNKEEGVNLASNRMTRYEQFEISAAIKNAIYKERCINSIGQLMEKQHKIPYEEVDLVFVIVDIVNTSVFTQNIYVSDADLSLAALKFLDGPKICGAEDLIFQGSVVCASNLHVESYKMHNGQVPCLLASNKCTFTTNPRLKCHQEAFEKLSKLWKSDNFVKKCNDSWSIFKTNFVSHRNLKPNTSLFKSVNISGSNPTPNLDTPSSSKRANLRISKLRGYGCPPNLPPLNSPVSVAALRKFKQPQFTPPSAIKRLNSPMMSNKEHRKKSKACDSSPIDLD